MTAAMAFEGLRVLDFTWVGVGPITTKYLADHGATVIHIESVSRPDVLRGVPPFKDAQPGINTSKYGLGLNMSVPQSRELVERIIGRWQPDIVAESFTPKTMRNWGLDYQAVRAIKPDIIYFSTCQMGQTGPHARYAGFGQLAAALAGFYHITGWPDRGPSIPQGAYADFVNPPNALAAIVAALEFRRRTGKGQHLDLSQFECATQFLAPVIMDYLANGHAMERQGNLDIDYAPNGVYPCMPEGTTESLCAIAVTSDEEWEALCTVMGNPSWTQGSRFSTAAGRKESEQELALLLGKWTANHRAHELMDLLQRAGVPAGVVQNQSDLWNDPQLVHRGFFQWLDHTECGPMPYDGLQFLLSKSPGALRMAHALVGEHNDLILKEFIGLTDDEVADLVAQEVLETSI